MLKELWAQYHRLDALIERAREDPDVPMVKMLQAQLAIRRAVQDIDTLIRIGQKLKLHLVLKPGVDSVNQDLEK